MFSSTRVSVSVYKGPSVDFSYLEVITADTHIAKRKLAHRYAA